MDADNEEELDVTVIDDAPKVATLNWEVGFRRLLVENAEFRAGHYRLYKHELIEAAFVNREDLLSFKDCFEEAELARLKGTDMEMMKDFSEILWENICEDPDKMDKLMKIACSRNSTLVDLVNEEIVPGSLEYYVMFFVGDPMKMDMITKTLEPIPVCDRLTDPEYQNIVREVRELMDDKCT
ncbi:hypothetical protein Tcan_04946 [Toxocara canis]|uniref:Uncharacterized protein n=1 Tax=Toxocara canis TaxID=6265 RepID=A0A0B2VVE8_TOXCA|nr:hypothetical protein Tcan_04946 [Toxocara canis]